MIEHGKNITYRLLRWSEKYTKTDMVYFSKGGFWLLAAKVANMTIGLVLAYAFANLIEPEKYGNYKYILTLVSVAGIFSLSGMGAAVSRSVAKGFESSLKIGVRHSFVWSIATVLVLLCGAGYYALNNNYTLGIGLLIAGAFTPFIASWSLYNSYLGGSQRYDYQAALSVIRNALPAFVIIPALFFIKEPAILTSFYFAMTACGVWLSYNVTLRAFKLNSRTDPELMGHAKHLSVMGVLDAFAVQMDKLLAFSQIGATALAIYSFALVGPQQLRDLSGIIANLALPKMSRKTFSELKRSIPGKSALLFLVACVLSVAYVFAAPFLFKMFFPFYMDSVAYSQVAVLTSLLVFPATLFNQALITHKKNAELYILKTLNPILRIGLMIGLLPFFGLWGLIGATLISYTFGFFLLLFLFFRAKDAPQTKEE